MAVSGRLMLLLAVTVVNGFNVDTENFIRHRGARGSMFGFTVAEHRERGASWVLVGAPEAQTRQPGVSRGGAVYRCDASRDDACEEIPFDRTGNNNNSDGRQIDLKSEQWFGATLQSSGEDGIVVACAPRYVWFSTTMTRRDPVGTCYVARNIFNEFSEYSPCRTERSWGHHRQGSCQAGLGASISKDGERLYIGAVGSWYWQGQMYSLHPQLRLPGRGATYTEGQLFSQSLNNRPAVLATKEGSSQDDDSYMGYSVAVGDFGSGYGPGGEAAVGMPRGAGLRGKIVLYTWNLTNYMNLTGEQLGAYFGYSLCVADLDGDSKDDLVVGAPLYTDLSNNEGKYETGRIYIFYQGLRFQDRFRAFHIRDGKNSKSRFGLSLSSLGDINKDGYGDIAVGAPYDGPDEKGAVYVYHGSREGILEKPSQIILAEHVMSTLSTFGFSVSGGMDLDENEYPDLVVGAYEADTAIFLRSRPVVNLGATVEFGAESKQLSLEDKSCSLIDGTAVSCTDLVACFEYSGIGVEKRLDFEIQFMLDAKKSKSPRMFFLTDEGKNVKNYTLRLEKESQLCKSYRVYIKNGIRDKLTALEAEMRYSLRTASGGSTSTGGRRRVTRSLTPVLDQSKELVRHDSISIQKNCGRDNICIPDLRLTVSPNTESYLLGSEKRLELNVFVENQGEDSFETMFIMGVPVGINYINIERVDHGAGAHDTLVQCSAPSSSNNNTLRCDLGNPLPQNRFVHFKVLLKPFHTEGMKSRYEFLIAVNSTNPEEEYTTDDNTIKIVIPIWVETETDIQGSSIPPDVFYNMSLYSANATFEGEIGPQVVHTYSVVNKGPSNIVEAEAYFVWPSYTLADEHLLYLLEAETEGPAVCEFVGEAQANPLNLRLDRKRKSYLEYSSGYSSSSGEAGASAEERFTSSRGSSSSSFSSSSSSSSSSSHSFSSSSSSSGRSGSSSSTARGRHNGSHGGSDISRNDHGNWLLSLTDEERERYEEEERRKQLEAELRRGSGAAHTEHWNSWESGNAGGGHIRHQSGVGRTEVHGAAATGRDQAQWSNERRQQEPGGYVHRQHWSSSEGHQSSSGGAVSGNGRERTEGDSTGSQTVHRQYWNSADSHQGGQGHAATGDARGSIATGNSETAHRQHWSSSESHHGGRGSAEVHHGGATGGGTGWSGAGNVSTDDGRLEQSWTYTSRNYSETVRKNDEAPKTYSNFTYSNASSNDGIGATAYGRSGQEASTSSQAGQQHSSGSHRGIGHGGAFTHYSNWSAESGDISVRGSDNGGTRHYTFSTETSDIANSGHGSGSGYRATSQNWDARATGSGSWNERGAAGSSSSSSGGGHFSTGLEEAALGTGGFRTYVFTPQVPESSDSGLTITRGHIGANSHIGIETSDASGGQEAYDSGSRNYGSSAGVEGNIRHHGGGGHSSSSSREVTHHHSSGHRTHYGSQSGGSDGFIPPGDNVDYSQYQQSSYASRGGHGGSGTHRQTGSSHHHSWSTETQNENDLEGNDDSAHLKHYGKFKDARRQRRNVGDDGELESAIRCNATRCSLIRCNLGPLAKGEAVNFAFRFRAWAHTLKSLGNNNAAKVSTLLATRLTKLPYIGAPNQASLRTEEVFTELVSTDTTPLRPEVVPLWVVVLSACAGAIILMLLVFLLWKCGFFKRNRPSDAPEKEPLNRNGHYQPGDEAL